MDYNEYPYGQSVLLETTEEFTDKDGTAVDPDVVRIYVQQPDNTESIYVYNVDPEVVRVTTGEYYMVQTCEQAGYWYYRIEGESSGGENMGAWEYKFLIKPTAFSII